MTRWQDRTAEETAALKDRRSRRRTRQVRNEQGLWQQRAKATDPADRAAAGWDWARRQIRRLPKDEQAKAWADLSNAVSRFNTATFGGDGQ